MTRNCAEGPTYIPRSMFDVSRRHVSCLCMPQILKSIVPYCFPSSSRFGRSRDLALLVFPRRVFVDFAIPPALHPCRFNSHAWYGARRVTYSGATRSVLFAPRDAETRTRRTRCSECPASSSRGTTSRFGKNHRKLEISRTPSRNLWSSQPLVYVARVGAPCGHLAAGVRPSDGGDAPKYFSRVRSNRVTNTPCVPRPVHLHQPRVGTISLCCVPCDWISRCQRQVLVRRVL